MEAGGGTKTWETLDSVALEKIFSYLSFDEKLSAGLVCQNWKTVSRSAGIWKTIELSFTGDEERFKDQIRFFQSISVSPTSVKLSFHSCEAWDKLFTAVRSAGQYLNHVSEKRSVQEVTLEFFDNDWKSTGLL